MGNKTGSVDGFVKKYSLPEEAKLELQVLSHAYAERKSARAHERASEREKERERKRGRERERERRIH